MRRFAFFLFALIASAEVLDFTTANLDDHVDLNVWLHFDAVWCGEPCTAFMKVLEEFSETVAGRLTVAKADSTSDLVQRFKIKGFPTSVYIRSKAGEFTYYSGNRTVEAMVAFASGDFRLDISYPVPKSSVVTSLVVPLTNENFEKLVLDKSGSYWMVLFSNPDDEGCQIIANSFEGLAKFERAKINFGKADKAGNDALFRRFQIDKVPSLWVFRGGKRYFYGGDFNFEDMQNFAEGGFGKHEGMKVEISEAGQAEQGDVIVLTDSDFDQQTKAMSPSNKVPFFVKFYTPWCGHCKAMAPIWNDLATDMKHKMKVGKMDCVAHKNTTERFAIPGFPVLLLFKNGKVWKYDGKLRTKEALVQWALTGHLENEGDMVPPPLGQALPEATWADLWVTAFEDFSNMLAYNPHATYTLFAGGLFAGAGAGGYVVLIYMVLRLASGLGGSGKAAAKGRPAPRKPKMK